MDAQGSGRVRKERWMKTALVVLSAAVVALATALALVAGQEGAITMPGGNAETQPIVEATVEALGADDAGVSLDKAVVQGSTTGTPGGIIETPVAAASVEASSAPDAAVSLDEPTAEPTDTATPDTAGGPSEGPVEGLSEAEHAALSELIAKFQDPERQLSESERVELVELASGLQAGTIIFPEEEDGKLMYRFYTGKEYSLTVEYEGGAYVYCPRASKEMTHEIWDKRIESERKYYEELLREIYPDFEGDYAEWDSTFLKNQEITLAQAFFHMYQMWFVNNVPFIGRSTTYGNSLYDDDDNYMGVGIEIVICPKVRQSDMPSESGLWMFDAIVTMQVIEAGLSTIEQIEEWWKRRNGGE